LKVRDLIIGYGIIQSRSEFKRLMLTGYLALICMSVSIIYTAVDIINEVYYALPGYVILFLFPLIAIWMLRNKYYKVAKVLLMIAVNSVVFWSALNDPIDAGTYLFFVAVGVGSFAIFGFDDFTTGLILVGFTSILFLLAFFGDLRPEGIPRPSAFYIQLSFIINFVVSLTISVLIVYFLMNLNKSSELDLIVKENVAQQKNAELQKVNDELDRFVYSVSHDLRSPLSSILGLINIAKHASSLDEVKDILTMIQGRVNAQDHFIREIMDYSRNARTETAREPIALLSLVDEVIDALKFNIHAEKIEFLRAIDADLIVHSDRIRLTIILSNLIGNAIKYHDFSKKNPFIEVGFHANPPKIYVRDNGTGMTPEQREKIFSMFYRGSDRSTGSGLGLFITKEAVSRLKGTIEVETKAGEGSTFKVIIPDLLTPEA
jgi:signal transduction histidine kinase